MQIFTHADRERLAAAEARLEQISRATGSHGVEVISLDESERSDRRAVPDALYVNRGDPYVRTDLYDARTDTSLAVAWGDWLEEAEQARGAA